VPPRTTSQLSMSSLLRLPIALAIVTCTVTVSRATQIDIPLRLDNEFIRQTLLAQLYTAPEDKAVLWDAGNGCGYLKLREPTVTSSGNRVRVVTRGEVRVGTPIGEQCLAPIQWDGLIEVFEEPSVSPEERALTFRVVQSNIYDSAGKKRLL